MIKRKTIEMVISLFCEIPYGISLIFRNKYNFGIQHHLVMFIQILNRDLFFLVKFDDIKH